MAGCCSRDYEKLFGRRAAARDARRYRKRGLTGSASELVTLAGDVHDASVLEVGGGIGSIELELFAAGAARATNVELSTEYEQEAAELLAERGLADRVERRIGDFVEDAAAIELHDVVVMHRVVCCYPDVDALVGAAAERTRRRLLLTYPRERPLVRLGARVVNLVLRLSGNSFRIYVHPVERIVAAAARHGLALEHRERNGTIWESAAFGATSAR
jgi:2-polyprenyl-3-methyl-5-hydroxy-6-metoxy-1,4-benzoquinol methylase